LIGIEETDTGVNTYLPNIILLQTEQHPVFELSDHYLKHIQVSGLFSMIWYYWLLS